MTIPFVLGFHPRSFTGTLRAQWSSRTWPVVDRLVTRTHRDSLQIPTYPPEPPHPPPPPPPRNPDDIPDTPPTEPLPVPVIDPPSQPTEPPLIV